MSHSKMTKRGRSLYIEKWNSVAKRFINTCSLCGKQGYSPTIDAEGFIFDDARKIADLEHRLIRAELAKVFKPLPLDALGRCPDCAAVMDK